MTLSALQTYIVWAIVAGVFITWASAGVYALWRAGQLNDKIGALTSLRSFFDNMIKTDRRHPVWVWGDGAIQTTPEVRNLLGINDAVSSLDEFSAKVGMPGLPKKVVKHIRSVMNGEKVEQTTFVADLGTDRTQIIVDIKKLMPVDESWPALVVWLEEYTGNSIALGRSGVHAMQFRVDSLASALNGLPFSVWVQDQDLKIIEVNDAYVKAVAGLSARAVVRENKLLFGVKQTQLARQVQQTQEKSRERIFGVVDGHRRAFSVTHVYLPEGDRILGLAVDVTGEEEALSELGRVLESQSETLNRLRSPVAIFGPAQTLRFYNSAFARLSHLPEDVLSTELKHSELLDIMYEKRRLPEQADFRKWKEDLLKQYTTLLEPFEEMWHLPDGTAHRVVSQPHPLGGLLILFEDVTDRLALERSYNTLIAVQQETLDNMRESVAVFGGDGALKLSNPAFASLWQLDDDHLQNDARLNDLLALLKTNDDFEEENILFKTQLQAAISQRGHRSGRWYRFDDIVIEYALVPLPDGGMMLTQSDVTDSFQIEKALRERSKALEAADKLKSEFITNMSYELRTPLNSIIGFSELLDQEIFGELNAHQKDYIKNILQGAGELKGMVADVLDLAVIEAGEMTLDIDKVDIMSAIKDSIDTAQEIMEKSSVTCVFEQNIKGFVEGDTRRLNQAFFNMISTILKFARSNTRLVIDTNVGKDTVTISVASEECNLSPRERDRLISTIAMGVSSGSRRSSGLDLALVRSIVTLHGGAVRLEAHGQEGIVLACDLPRKAAFAAGLNLGE
jgi:signal transduction histidine kinase